MKRILVAAVSFACVTAMAYGGPITARGSAAAPGRGSLVHWQFDRDGPRKSYTMGGITISLAAQRNRDAPVAELLVTTSYPNGNNVESDLRKYPVPVGTDVLISVARVDPGSRYDQVLLSYFTGGAHCCMTMWVITQAGDGSWIAHNLPDGDASDYERVPRDLDGDGIADFVISDLRFDDAFGPHSESVLIPRVVNVRGKDNVDVSDSGRYRQLYLSDMVRQKPGCLHHSNAACAAYVADAARAGQLAAAWGVMKANYNANTKWDYPGRNKSFPRGLASFLTDNGIVSGAEMHRLER